MEGQKISAESGCFEETNDGSTIMRGTDVWNRHDFYCLLLVILFLLPPIRGRQSCWFCQLLLLVCLFISSKANGMYFSLLNF